MGFIDLEGAMKTSMIPSIDRFIIRILGREGK
jgi:hypothetical protein